MNSAKVNYFLKLDDLIQSSIKSYSDLPNKLCNILISDFELEAAALFKINSNQSVELIGKSSTVKKSLEINLVQQCENCEVLSSNNKMIFTPLNNCKIIITERVMFQGCVVIPLSNGSEILLNVAKPDSFSNPDTENMNQIIKFIKTVLDIWVLGKGSVENSISMIISSLAQELRTPANGIVGFSSLLSEDSLSSVQNEYVSNLKDNAFSLLALLNDLIDLSKLESGLLKPIFNSVNLNDFISDTISAIKTRIENKSVEIIFDIDKSISEQVNLDSQKLKYILQTLIVNSIKLTDKGRISLSVKSTSNKVLHFRIIDTSNGLTSKKVADFFKPFGLQESYNLKIGNITGLSLFLTKKYIDLLGGYVTVNSNIGKGIVIDFNIVAEGHHKTKKLDQIPKPTLSKNKILVVEDDYATSKLLSNYLTKWGYDPVIINSYKQAFNLVETEVFLAIMVDVNLPEINGFELMKQLRLHPNVRHTPIIVLSVESEEQKAFMMGAVEYFQKPINYRYLVETLMSYKLKKDSTILIVDDDLPTLNLIKSTVEQIGFNTIALEDSSKVMNYIENTHLDLAIIDLDMPIINGFDLIKMIKSKSSFLIFR
jgi:DNA-binding response OmpR family regulator/signal transduction histidine kinase